jgi:hypothetical protein
MFHIGPPWLQNTFFLVSRKSAPVITPAEANGKRVVHMSAPLGTEMSLKFLGKSRLILATTYNDLIDRVCTAESDAAFLEGRALEQILLELPHDCSDISLRAAPSRMPLPTQESNPVGSLRLKPTPFQKRSYP